MRNRPAPSIGSKQSIDAREMGNILPGRPGPDAVPARAPVRTVPIILADLVAGRMAQPGDADVLEAGLSKLEMERLRRHRLYQAIRAECPFYGNIPRYRAAEAMRADLARYHAGSWRRGDCDAAALPADASAHRIALHRILRLSRGEVLGAARLAQILAGAHAELRSKSDPRGDFDGDPRW